MRMKEATKHSAKKQHMSDGYEAKLLLGRQHRLLLVGLCCPLASLTASATEVQMQIFLWSGRLAVMAGNFRQSA